jgi:hypothetical protein
VPRHLGNDDRQSRAIASFKQWELDHHACRAARHDTVVLDHGGDPPAPPRSLVGGIEMPGKDETRRQAVVRKSIECWRAVIDKQAAAMGPRYCFEPYRITRPAPRPALACQQQLCPDQRNGQEQLRKPSRSSFAEARRGRPARAAASHDWTNRSWRRLARRIQAAGCQRSAPASPALPRAGSTGSRGKDEKSCLHPMAARRPPGKSGAVEKTRTSTAFRPQPPQGCASTIPPRPHVNRLTDREPLARRGH